MGLTDEEKFHLSNLRVAMSIISFICTIIFIAAIFVLKLYKEAPQRIIGYILISAWFLSIFDGFSDWFAHSGFGCYFRAVGIFFFDFTIGMWSVCIALNLFLLITKRQKNITEKMEKWYHLIAWGVSGLLAAIPAMIGQYGKKRVTSRHCWLLSSVAQSWLFYFPLALVFLTVVVLYCVIAYRFVQTTKSAGQKLDASRKKLIGDLLAYPIVFLISWLFSAVATTGDYAWGGSSGRPSWLTFCSTFFVTSQGLWNCMAYGRNVYNRARKKFQSQKSRTAASASIRTSRAPKTEEAELEEKVVVEGKDEVAIQLEEAPSSSATRV